MSTPLLVIGNKNYSSWSLRAWLAMRKSGVGFEEHRLSLDTPAFEEQIGERSPTRRVPVLRDGDLCIWDSLAICEYANERWAQGALLPADAALRATVRSYCAEMHAGFPELRSRMPMNCRARNRKVSVDDALTADIDRVLQIWSEARERRIGDGSWLLGEFSLLDAMYVPVALRFRTYDVPVPGLAGEFMAVLDSDPDILAWLAEALVETEVVEADEAGH
jgi:glutathione S-transferase